ncbi:MAG TPA: TlpA disulfide reductase family protein [Fibrobacteria bacterium]|nr:TlpA disulfide reductase family protein [Fibrobacteria bacterium]
MSSSALPLSTLALTLSLGLLLAPLSHGAGPVAAPTGTPAAASAPAAKGPATLPVFTLRDLEDKDHSSTDWKGKVVLIDFWATWCAGCRETIPALARLKEKYGANGLAVVGVSLDKGSKSKVAKFATKFKVNYQILLDSEDTLSKVFGFEGLPSLYLFDRDGRLLKAMTGYTALQDKELEALVATQFAGK